MPKARWAVGCGAELRRRLMWRDVPVGKEEAFADVACTRLPDGTAIAVCYDNYGSLQTWNLATGSPYSLPLGWPGLDDRGPWRNVACTRLPDGTPVAVTGGGDGTLRVWDLLDGRLRCESPVGLPQDKVFALACARLADGTAVAVTGSEAGTIRFWDVATGRPRDRTLRCDRPLSQVACTSLADDTPVAVIGDGALLRVWDLSAGRFRGGPVATDFDVHALACLRLGDGTSLAIVGSDRLRNDDTAQRYGTVQAWDLATGHRHGGPLNEHSGEIGCLAATLLADGTPVAVSRDRHGAARAWDLSTGRGHGPPLPRLGDSPALACATLPDGTPVLVSADDDVQVWSLVVAPSAEGLTGPIWTVGCVELPGGDEVVVTAGQEDRVGYVLQLWQADTGNLRERLLTGHADDGVACARLRDGTPVVLTAEGNGVRLWDLVSGRPRDVVLAGHSGELDVLDCATRHDADPILITGGPVRAWDVGTGQPYGPPLPVKPYWDRAISCLPLPDGTLLAILLDEHEHLQAWDLRTGRAHGPRLTSALEVEEIDAVAGIPLRDGTPLAVYGTPFRLHTWDLAAGRAYGRPLQLSTSFIPEALACTRLPDGTALVAAGGLSKPERDGVVEVWDLEQRQVRQVIRVPEPVLGLAFTTGHRLVVRTFLDIAVYDVGDAAS